MKQPNKDSPTSRNMTSFQYPPTMAASHYEHYSNDAYPDYMATTSQAYPVTSGFPGPAFSAAAMSSVDSYSTATAFAEPSKPHEDFRYAIDSTGAPISSAHIAYTTAPSPGEHMLPQLSTSSESGNSVHSTSSSAIGSPHLQPQYQAEGWNPLIPSSGLHDMASHHHDVYFSSSIDQEPILASHRPGFVDPSILNPFPSPMYQPYHDMHAQSPRLFEQPASPAPSNHSNAGRVPPSPRHSPYLHAQQYHPYHYGQRRLSNSSAPSKHSHSSSRSGSLEGEEGERERGLCPIPECGRVFKDLKAHMLTHQNERPEKCPIQTCEYHVKGFARKYDKNRHTLTHYKGTMVCGFCPGSGSAAEKSFNRADVFKRHLTSVHGVEQAPPNSRRKSPSASKKGSSAAALNPTSGTCSTCSVTFANAQDFYEHLDDCVLRVVQQIDPAEAINQKHLAGMSEDKAVQETLEKHHLPATVDYDAPAYDEDDEDDDEELIEADDANDGTYGSRRKGAASKSKSGLSKSTGGGSHNNRVGKSARRAGLTWSKGGVMTNGLAAAAGVRLGANGRKRRKNYPTSWGQAPEKMKMRKRVLCVYDGPRRLWKDDMMLDSEFEVRVQLPGTEGSRSYITDLDVQTLKRAEAIQASTEEERGVWRPDNIMDADIADMML